jgi:selenide,water dikinase
METSDDAGVYLVSEDLAIIQTVDYFTPIVDDPYTFGAIAVANSLSDVYAMGGAPLSALNIVLWDASLPSYVLGDILRGGAETLMKARCALVGGHSADSPELMYGASVLGTARPQQIVRNCTARPGDALLLTKPLGVGVLATAAKFDDIRPDQLQPAVDSMLMLNEAAADVMRQFGARAATDVTGFGLVGHAFEMAKGSAVGVRLFAEQVPVLDGVLDLIRSGTATRAPRANSAFVGEHLHFGEGVPQERRPLLLEAETSGGLLIAVAPETAQPALDALRSRGCTYAAHVGVVESGPPGSVCVEP